MPTKKPAPGAQQAPSQVDVIVADCLAADPSLAPREAELREIVVALLVAKPDTRIDETFSQRLRSLLVERAEATSASAALTPAKPSFIHSFFQTMQNKPLAYALSGGAMLTLLLVAVLVRPNAVQQDSATMPVDDFAAGGPAQITTIASNGFGSLLGTGGVTPMMAPVAEGDDGVSAPLGSPETRSSIANPRPQSGGGGGGSGTMTTMVATPDAKMIAPYDPVNYNYVYEGEVPVSDASVGVYRHVKGLNANTDFSAFRSMLNGLLDGNKVRGGRIQSISVMEDREYGYMINVDAVEGTASLSQNWMRWPHPEAECRDEACYQRYQIMGDQVPSDAEMIAVADDFLSEYGISGDHLGQPEVRSDWRTGVISPLAMVYAPSAVSVVYPLMLDGQAVVDESGMPYGVNVSVSIRERKVEGLWGLTTNRYERSEYDAETDGARILEFVRAGGGNSWTDPNATKTIDINLGTPEVVLSRYWHTDANNVGQELFVPMLRFPVLNPPEDQPWFRKSVMVPLAKELLDQMINSNGVVPMPMPLIREDAAPAGTATDPAAEPAVDTATDLEVSPR